MSKHLSWKAIIRKLFNRALLFGALIMSLVSLLGLTHAATQDVLPDFKPATEALQNACGRFMRFDEGDFKGWRTSFSVSDQNCWSAIYAHSFKTKCEVIDSTKNEGYTVERYHGTDNMWYLEIRVRK